MDALIEHYWSTPEEGLWGGTLGLTVHCVGCSTDLISIENAYELVGRYLDSLGEYLGAAVVDVPGLAVHFASLAFAAGDVDDLAQDAASLSAARQIIIIIWLSHNLVEASFDLFRCLFTTRPAETPGNYIHWYLKRIA